METTKVTRLNPVFNDIVEGFIDGIRLANKISQKDIAIYPTDEETMLNAYRVYKDNPQELVDKLSAANIAEYKIISFICKMYEVKDLKNFAFVYQKAQSNYRWLQSVKFSIPDNYDHYDKGVIDTVKELRGLDIKANDILEYVKDNFSFYQILFELFESADLSIDEMNEFNLQTQNL